jgi:stage II sporulation protein M
MDDLLGSLPDTSNMNLPELFAFIAVNNIGKSFLFMAGGIIGGVLPLFFVIFNGFFIGYIAYSLGSIFGITYIIAGLTPHGIFEIPAIVFAMAIGMNLGYAAMNALRGEGSIWKEARLALGLFLTRITPILLFAAVIEVTITPLLLAWLGYV